MLRENLQTFRENTEIFIKPSKDFGLEVNSDKTKYMITSRQQNIVQNQNVIQNENVVIKNVSFKKVKKFKYLGVAITNTNDIREENKRRINMGNPCYYSLEKCYPAYFPRN